MKEKIFDLLERHKLTELKPIVSEMNEVELAEIFEELGKEERTLLFRILPKDLAAETFVELETDTKRALIEALTDRELGEVINEMFADDTVDLIEEMPANVVKRLLRQSDSETRKTINELLRYSKDSAGSIMTTEFISLFSEMTVDAALAKIKRRAIDSETIYTCYVTDSGRRLEGFVTVKALLLAEKDTKISEIMESNVIFAHTDDGREEVSRMLADYDFLALPIVDRERRIVGIVTVDDAIDVIEEETTEDIAKMAAVLPTGVPYLKRGVFAIFKSRIPWLLLLMISATFTGLIINSFESRLNAISSVLFAVVPMMMDTGGNSGSQASVTVIRALSLGELEISDVFRVVWKELRASLLLGVTLGVACFLKLLIIDNLLFGFSDYTPIRCLVISAALVVTVVIAKLVGCTLPILAKKLKLDPAVVASPFITTIVDALSLMLYCSLAVAVLS